MHMKVVHTAKVLQLRIRANQYGCSSLECWLSPVTVAETLVACHGVSRQCGPHMFVTWCAFLCCSCRGDYPLDDFKKYSAALDEAW
jgi:hypothetical protein